MPPELGALQLCYAMYGSVAQPPPDNSDWKLPGDPAASGRVQQALQCYWAGQVPEVTSPALWGPRQAVCQACGCGASLGRKTTPKNGSPGRFPVGTFWPRNGLCPLPGEATACQGPCYPASLSSAMMDVCWKERRPCNNTGPFRVVCSF